MASVKERHWKTSKGEDRSAYMVIWRDAQNKRRFKNFKRKKDADTYRQQVERELYSGTHVPDSASITVASAAGLWIETGEAAGLERTTIDQRRQHLKFHIEPFIGATKLNKLSIAMVRQFQDDLRRGERSPGMVKRVTTSLHGVLVDAQERGLVGQNVVAQMRKNRSTEKRHKKRLEIGVDIPSAAEVSRLIAALPGQRFRPLLITAIFTGLRASELRGLRWKDIDLQSGLVNVRQRADRYNNIGSLKTSSSFRSVPVPPVVTNTLREWKLACPIGELDLVFPTGKGGIQWHGNIIRRGLWPACEAAGLVNEVGKLKYTGMHALRHFYASWCINRKSDGGRELKPKAVQELLGHSSIVMTLDVYGHLFPSDDDGAELAAASAALIDAS